MYALNIRAVSGARVPPLRCTSIAPCLHWRKRLDLVRLELAARYELAAAVIVHKVGYRGNAIQQRENIDDGSADLEG